MKNEGTSSRRSFLKKGAILAVPLAAAAPAAVIADDGLKSRLAKLEDEEAIRELHHHWLRQVNSGAAEALKPLIVGNENAGPAQSVSRIAADHTAEADSIEVTGDGKAAKGRFHCVVDLDTPLAQDCTLAQMAHAQGDGFVRRTERRVLTVDYRKNASGAWTIAKAEVASA
jgi:hypothetical protein